MNTKYVMYQYFDTDLNCQVIVIDYAKNVMTFFDQTIDDNTNDIVVFEIRQFDYEIHRYINSSLIKNRQ